MHVSTTSSNRTFSRKNREKATSDTNAIDDEKPKTTRSKGYRARGCRGGKSKRRQTRSSRKQTGDNNDSQSEDASKKHSSMPSSPGFHEPNKDKHFEKESFMPSFSTSSRSVLDKCLDDKGSGTPSSQTFFDLRNEHSVTALSASASASPKGTGSDNSRVVHPEISAPCTGTFDPPIAWNEHTIDGSPVLPPMADIDVYPKHAYSLVPFRANCMEEVLPPMPAYPHKDHAMQCDEVDISGGSISKKRHMQPYRFLDNKENNYKPSGNESERIHKQKQMPAGSLFVTSPRSFLMGRRAKTTPL